MLFNLRGLQEMFSFIEKLYSKIFSHFLILAIFGEFGVILLRLLQEINLWRCYFTYGDYK